MTKPMGIKQAAELWVTTKQKLRELEPQLDAAEQVLKPYFRRTGRGHYGRIGYARTTFQAIDAKAVKKLLGPEVVKVQATRERETLSLLGVPDEHAEGPAKKG